MPEAPQVFYEIATRRLDAQMQQIDQLDAKVATLFVSASGILAIFAGLLSLAALPANTVIKALVLVALALASAMYAALLYFLYRAYQIGEWHFRPNVKDLKANCGQYDEPTMREWVADECLVSLRQNTGGIARKAQYLKSALLVYPLEAILLVIAGAITLLSK